MIRWKFLVCLAALLFVAGGYVGDATLEAQSGGTISGTVQAPSPRMQANAVVYLKKVAGHFPAKKQAEMDQKGLKFLPHVLPVLKGTTVRFDNHDPTVHNVFSPDGKGYDLGSFNKGQSATHTFNSLGVFTQLCRVHPEMIAYVVVLQNPYYAVTGSDGSFQIKNVPPGHYQLMAWQERGKGGPVNVTVRAGKDTKTQVKLGH